MALNLELFFYGIHAPSIKLRPIYQQTEHSKCVHIVSASLCFVLVWFLSIYRSHKSHNAPVTYPTIHHLEEKWTPMYICYILYEFWICEIFLRLKRLMCSMYSHMFSILLTCPHMFYNHWLDAIAATLFFLMLYVSKFHVIFIVYVI